MSVLRISFLGGLTLTWGEMPLPPIPGAAPRSLLAYLLVYRDRPHTRDLLAGAFWPDLPDAIARRRLSQALWQIRRTLVGGVTFDDDISDAESVSILLTKGDTVQLNPDLPLWLDVEEFGRLGTRPPIYQSTNLPDLSKAVELYRGDFLAGYYDDWLFPERERLREQFLEALGRLVAGYKAGGEYERALTYARRLASEDPWREESHREVMRLCHLLGRGNEALKQFETCRRVLADELGADPLPETVALAREIAIRSSDTAPPVLPEFPPSPTAILLEASKVPLVGREAERNALLAHVDALFQGIGGIVLVEGEAGVGKTRLLQTVTGDARWRGAEVLWAGEQESGAATPYGPLLAALNEGLSPLRAGQLAQLVEEIWLQALAALLPPLAAARPDLPPPPKLEPAQERDRLTAALAQLLAGWARIAPLLLVLEDLHWAGEGALDLLARLAPSLGGQAVLLVGSYRSEEARARAGVWQKVQALDRAGVKHRLALSGLDAPTTGELIRRCLGMGSPAPLFESRLHRETQGNPLFVLETLRALHGEGLLVRDADGQWRTPWDETTADYAELPLPRAVEQTIARRLAMLPPALEQTIRLAAVLGERFDFALLHAAGEQKPPTLLAALRSLVQRRFVDETERDYRFSHDKIRQVAYEGIGAPERVALHRRAAQAFEALQPERAATLAYHWTRAEVWDKAADLHQRAGDRARAVYANAKAATHYTQTLEALSRLPVLADPDRVFELLLAREAVYALQGDRIAQTQDLATLKEMLADPSLDTLDRRVRLWLRRLVFCETGSDYAQASMLARETAELARQAGDPNAEGQACLHWGRLARHQGEWPAAQTHLARALALAQDADDAAAQVIILSEVGALYHEKGDLAAAQTHYQNALECAAHTGDRAAQVVLYNNLGNLWHDLARYDEAIAHHRRALALRRELGDRRGEAISLYNLSTMYHDKGDLTSARRTLEQVCTLAHAIGDRRVEGYAYAFLGVALEALGELDAAQDAYAAALELRRELGLLALAVDALAGLARVASAQGNHEQAVDLATEVLAWLDESGIEGVGDPLLAYQGAYRALLAAGQAERGRAALQVAYDLLISRAEGVGEGAPRRAYLHDIEPNRGILADYQALGAQQNHVRLPRAEAPLGRPLRDDEYVTVAWTVAAPEDRAIAKKVARRRCRIQRLLAEAQAQGAAPRDQDLAAALGVGLRTLRRDMAALRAEGHDLPTRWRRRKMATQSAGKETD